MKFKTIKLNDDSVFNIFIGERVLKKDIYRNTDRNIPLYSANIFKPMGYVKKSNIKSFKNNFVIWGIDGNFEFNVIEKTNIFASTDHCGCIEILDDNIDPYYLKYQLSITRKKLGFDRSLRSNLKNMGNIILNLPIKEDSSDKTSIINKRRGFRKIENDTSIFDIDYQKQFLKRLSIFETIKTKFEEIKSEIQKTFPIPKLENSFKKINLSNIFNFEKTNTGVTKKFCIENEGNIPVYGASKNEKSVLGNIKDNLDNIHYYKKGITWNRNGFVGKFFVRDHKFSTNEDHYVLSLKEQYISKMNLNYLRYEIEKEVKKAGFDYTMKLGKQRLSEIDINIPYENNNISLSIQNKINQKIQNINDTKEKYLSLLNRLTDMELKID